MNFVFCRTKFVFPQRISSQLCVLTSQIHVHAEDFQSNLRSGTSGLSFRHGILMNSVFRQLSARRGLRGFEDAAH